MLTADDKAGIAETLAAFDEAWKTNDSAAFSAIMTDDCDWINVVGMHWRGKAQVVKAHHRLLMTRFKGVKVHSAEHDETEIAPNTALVIVTSTMDDFTTPDGQRLTNIRNRGSFVLVKQDGKWLFRSGQNTTIDAAAALHDPGKN